MESFNGLVDELTGTGSNSIPAISVLIKDKQGETILSKISGQLNLSPDSPAIDASTIFRLSSSTKLFTALAALQCVERGLIKLDQPIRDVLPEFKDKDIISQNQEKDESGKPKFSFTKARSPITLRQLLTHTSGIGYDMMNPSLIAWRGSRGEAPQSMSGYSKGMFDAPLIFEPGSSWMYGAGYDAVGVLVSRLNNDVGLEAYMQHNIFNTLKLQSPTFFIRRHGNGDGLARLVQCVTRNRDGVLVGVPDPTADNAAEEQGSGGLYSSVPDYVAVLVDLLQDEPKLLKRQTADLLFTPQLEKSSPALQGFTDAQWLWGAFSGGANSQEQKVNHSLGGILVEDEGSKPGKGSLRWGGGSGTLWCLDRGKGIAAFSATQIFPPFDAQSTKLREAFASLVGSL